MGKNMELVDLCVSHLDLVRVWQGRAIELDLVRGM
jgi:hypothetical protein